MALSRNNALLNGCLKQKQTTTLFSNYLLSELSSVLESSSSCTGTLMSWKSSLLSVKHSHSKHLVLSTNWPWNNFSTSSKTASSVPRESICHTAYLGVLCSDTTEPGDSLWIKKSLCQRHGALGILHRNNLKEQNKTKNCLSHEFSQYHSLLLNRKPPSLCSRTFKF